ncbi:hypothetical protein C8R43DRAFT_639519 [Mycena crocata]|nr:hypothetical protein C8R43DRAFT_639519 [Mycena crocata]
MLFPDEIFDRLARHVPLSDLLALCRADRRMYAICLPHIYHTVDVKTPDALIKFCDALSARETLPPLVESLRIDFEEYTCTVINPAQSNPLNDRALRATCATAIGRLPGLTSLAVLHASYLLPLLPLKDSLPKLNTLTTSFSHHIIPLLKSHPALTSLHVSAPSKPTHGRVQFPRIALPELQSFSGPEILARAVLPGSRVRNAVVIWAQRAPARKRRSRWTGAAKWLAQLQQQERITALENVFVVNVDAAPAVCLLLATVVPGIMELKFRLCGELLSSSSAAHSSVTGTQPSLSPAFRAALIVALPTFGSLTTLSLFKPLSVGRKRELALLNGGELGLVNDRDLTLSNNRELRLLNVWHALCPTLQDCTLPSGARWVRLTGGWVHGDGLGLQASEQLPRHVSLEVIPRPTLAATLVAVAAALLSV